MGHQTVNTNVFKTQDAMAELRDVVASHSQPAHTRIDLNVDVGDDARVPGGEIERFNPVEAVNDWCQVPLQASALLTLPKSTKTENWPGNSGSSQFYSFFRQGHAEPVDAFSFQTPSTGHGAVTVRVRFHRSHHLLLATDMFAYHAQIFG